MKIATWNVNGIRARLSQVQDWLVAERPDVFCLQEIKASADQVPIALWEMEGYWCYWHGERAYSGVALLVRQETVAERPTFCHPPFDYESRIAEVRLPSMRVATVYVPNGGKDYAAKIRFLDALIDYAHDATTSDVPLVLCGDMNVTRTDMDVHPKERKPDIMGQRPEERARFERVLAEGLVDVARTLEPDNDAMYTWWAPWRNMRERNIGWRLDYVLASTALAVRVQSCRTLREFGTSDHGPVVVEFQ